MPLKDNFDILETYKTLSSSIEDNLLASPVSDDNSFILSADLNIHKFIEPAITSYFNYTSERIKKTIQLFNSTSSSIDIDLIPQKEINVIKKNDEFQITEKTYNAYESKQSELTEELVSKYIIILKRIIRNDSYESGVLSEIEQYMNEYCNDSNLLFIKEAAQQIFWDNYSDTHMMQGILRLLRSKSYDEMNSQGQTICFGLMQHKSITIRDQALQTFENWNSKKALKQLRSVYCPTEWMKKHMNKVLHYIELHGSD